jgi:hypothetical protein
MVSLLTTSPLHSLTLASFIVMRINIMIMVNIINHRISFIRITKSSMPNPPIAENSTYMQEQAYLVFLNGGEI